MKINLAAYGLPDCHLQSQRHCQVDGAGVFGRCGGWDHPAFVDAAPSSLYKGHRFPVEIIS
ncbi:MAG: hypothetical protein M3460_25015, partial [Actinomycetota bacterium]|nr:hypothetical protein [Actinomycetota bacterium]